MKNNSQRKITPQKRQELIDHYLAHGREASMAKCEAAGVSPGYAANMAGQLGLKPPRRFKGGGAVSLKVNHKDPRWAWAIERGPVIA